MKKFFLFFVALVLFYNANSVFACTNLLVTKGASVDGSTFISYTADSHVLYGELYYRPAADYQDNTYVDIYEWDTYKYLGKIKQVKHTYSVVGNMNEHQLTIGETTFGGREELKNNEGILDYGSLIYITLQRAKTAREAIKTIGELVSEYGYYSSGESFSIADPNEVWHLEIIGKGSKNKGAVWVAVRIPDGYVGGHANHARIRKFALKDPENCIYSPDVISFAKEMGYYKGKDEDFSFRDAYDPSNFHNVRFCDARVWSMFRRINADVMKYENYALGIENAEELPLFIKPDKKLSVHDVMELMRDHFEGTQLDMTKDIGAGPYACPYRWRPLTWKFEDKEYFNERAVSTQQTGFSFVAQMRASLPSIIGGVLWFGVDDSYTTVYVPMYCGINEIPYNYRVGTGSFTQFTWDAAFWVFNWVSNYAYLRYSDMVKDIQIAQRNLEGQFLANQLEVEKTAKLYYDQSPLLAREYLTKYSAKQAEFTVVTWKKLGEQLLFKYLDGNIKDEYNKPKHIGYPESWRKAIVQETGDKLQIKYFTSEINDEYNATINKADALLKEKKYKEALQEYQNAIKIKGKENEIYPKNQIEKINTLLIEIDKLHKEIIK